ncbi:winged helix-turn-helix domain-containing protein [Chryseobacterium sp. CT-SW4]|uniref:winged helix-turn-helix domain-containing protein n=1 Tax=Chryseobacterium sp. SW-1 TaxID=3157343 RepID=UPI003B011EE1
MKTERKPTTGDNKGLQKLTESENKLNAVLALERITPEDIKDLTREERNKLGEILTHKLNILTDDEKAKLYDQVVEIMDPRTKNEIWEFNHINMMWGISALIQEKGRMPNKTEIANKIGISRQTVHKHLKEYKESPYYKDFQAQFEIMHSKIMTTVFQLAVKGDIKACRLYLECIGGLKGSSSGNSSNNTLVQNQNNYIQINGMVLSQETVKNLNPEQLNTIEGILKTIEVKEVK